MRKFALLLCILVMLIAATSAASAGKKEPDTFTIKGITQSLVTETLPSGITKFQTVATGTVSGNYFEGAAFTFEETGIGSYDLTTYEARATNHGVMTITNGSTNVVVIRFDGQADFWSVRGHYRILQGTGQYAGLHSEGTYQGTTDLGEGFTVVFSGDFHSKP
jgi:hypothetical protein